MSEHSAAAVPRQKQKVERRGKEEPHVRVRLLKQQEKKKNLRIFGTALIYFMLQWHSSVINAALAGNIACAPRPEICGAQTPTFRSDLYAR